MNRFPSKTNALRFLRGAGLEVQTILDVGVMTSTRELMDVFPDKKHLLFEPMLTFHGAIQKNYADIDHELVAVAVSNRNGVSTLRIDREDGTGRVTHARITDERPSAGNPQSQTVTLDSFLSTRQDGSPYLLKVDVDGHELEILHGARETLKKTACVAVEVHPDNFLRRSQFLEDAGFYLCDLVDLCYNGGVFAQADMIFVRKELRSLFKPPEKFEWERWRNLSWYESGVDWSVP